MVELFMIGLSQSADVDPWMTKQKKFVVTFCALLVFVTAFAHAETLAQESTSVAATADRFGQALKSGDEATVRALLDEHVLIFESGGVESSLAEYASHHMGADIVFMADMEKEIISREVFEGGEFTVVSTRYRMHGSYKGRDFDQVSSETLVLKNTADGWKIVHIHWS